MFSDICKQSCDDCRKIIGQSSTAGDETTLSAVLTPSYRSTNHRNDNPRSACCQLHLTSPTSLPPTTCATTLAILQISHRFCRRSHTVRSTASQQKLRRREPSQAHPRSTSASPSPTQSSYPQQNDDPNQHLQSPQRQSLKSKTDLHLRRPRPLLPAPQRTDPLLPQPRLLLPRSLLHHALQSGLHFCGSKFAFCETEWDGCVRWGQELVPEAKDAFLWWGQWGEWEWRGWEGTPWWRKWKGRQEVGDCG